MSTDTSSANGEQHVLAVVAERLRTAHNSALVVIHDTNTEHIGYWDKSERLVEAQALEYVQEQGFYVVHAGSNPCRETGREQAWMEVRRKDPREVYGDRTKHDGTENKS